MSRLENHRFVRGAVDEEIHLPKSRDSRVSSELYGSHPDVASQKRYFHNLYLQHPRGFVDIGIIFRVQNTHRRITISHRIRDRISCNSILRGIE